MEIHKEQEVLVEELPQPARVLTFRFALLVTLTAFLAGIMSGFLLWGRSDPPVAAVESPEVDEAAALETARGFYEAINPAEGYAIPYAYGELGPQLLEAGAIDYDLFLLLYEQKGLPLTTEQQTILAAGSEETIVMTRENADFLLNFFWAVGLVNENPILLEGPMMKYGEGDVGRFASTGGWTIGLKSPVELYASVPLLSLTLDQQQRLDQVAQHVFRPCCNNPVYFPDCNHGMAMLGMLTLMASNDASVEAMFEAAKYANAFWFPQQTMDLAVLFQTVQQQSFAEIDGAVLVGENFSSGSGYQQVRSWLAGQGLIEQPPGSGSNCGV